ncbi:MAG: alpha/beta hydrolase [Actinomycetota bacterium]
MDETFESDGLRLGAHVARPNGSGPSPAVVLCHGFPSGPRGAATSAATYPELADRIARDAGWTALAFNLRGAGTSEGDFSVDGWLRDVGAAVGVLAERNDVSGVWIAGIGEGGTFAVCTAAGDARVSGVATLGAPASLHDWAREPARFLAHTRRVGMVRTAGFPADPAAWGRELATLDAVAAARRLRPRPLLVVHGSADDTIPGDDARALCDAAGPGAELRIVHSAGHRLRHDPRAIALLIGWLDRQST